MDIYGQGSAQHTTTERSENPQTTQNPPHKYTTMRPTQRQQLRTLIDSALTHSPYPNDPNLHNLWCIGVLKELLSYSAQNQLEVWHHLERLKQRNDTE